MVTENPFLKESPLPYQLPPFNRINDSDYRPAFEAGMEERLREVAARLDDAPAREALSALSLWDTALVAERVARREARAGNQAAKVANTDPVR